LLAEYRIRSTAIVLPYILNRWLNKTCIYF